MLISTIIFLAVIILAAFILFKIFHSIIKTAVTIFIVLIVTGLVLGFFIVKDANDFNKTFKSENSIYVLSDEDEIYAGFEALAFDFDTYDEKSISDLSSILDDESYLGKKIIINPEALDFNLPENINISLELLLESEDYSERSLAFKYGLFNTISDEGPLFLIHHLRDGSLEILPKSMIIKAVTFTPKSFLSRSKVKVSASKAKLNGFVDNFNNITGIDNNESEVVV